MDRCERSLRFIHLEFDKKAISDWGKGVKLPRLSAREFGILQSILENLASMWSLIHILYYVLYGCLGEKGIVNHTGSQSLFFGKY